MTLPQGFRYAAVYAGIRKARKNDLTLIVSDTPASAAGVFTINLVQAAPVRLTKQHLAASKGVARAVLINAGNANCATRTGDKVALSTSKALAKLLRAPVEQVLPASTGVIGVELDPALIVDALPGAVAALNAENFLDAAEAIMTTDTVRKAVATSVDGVSIAGMTKGAGMIHPGMATTLAFVMTDAVIEPSALSKALKSAVKASFNRISIDGDMSTNDTLLVLANGASGRKPNAAKFTGALTEACQSLAKQIARDGEGARKLIEISVEGARTNDDAVRIARAIANSPLVKTAIAGSDPNWGRIICAAGYSGGSFEPGDVNIWLNGVKVCKKGLAAEFDEAELSRKLDAKDCSIRFQVSGGGEGAAKFWTCDFTHDYITINASYRT